MFVLFKLIRLVYIPSVAANIMKYSVREINRVGNILFETRVYHLPRNKEKVRVATFILVDGAWYPTNEEAQFGDSADPYPSLISW